MSAPIPTPTPDPYPTARRPRLGLVAEAEDRWRWLTWGSAIGFVVAAAFATWGMPGVGVPEPQHQLGWVTPTCGLTRGVTSIAAGDVGAAWGWNPASILVVVAWGAALVRGAVGWRTGRWWTPTLRPGVAGWALAVLAVALLWANQQAHAEHIIHGTL